MAQTALGALKVKAKRSGLSLEHCQQLVAEGFKLCYCCKIWKAAEDFCLDATRYDGRSPKCRLCKNGPGTKAEKISRKLKGRVSTFKGRMHSDSSKAIMSEKRKLLVGEKSPRYGVKHTPQTRAKISAVTRERTPRGSKCYNFSHGKFQRALNDRRRPEYKDWRTKVFQRDNYTCQKCGDSQGGNLRAHHKLPFASHPELRFDVDNGITLCSPCHDLEHYKPDSVRNTIKARRGKTLF